MNIDFIRGVIKTLNYLHLKLNENDRLFLPVYGCYILDSNNVKGTIYFDVKKQEYLYSEFK